MTKDLNRLSATEIMGYEVGETNSSGGVWVRTAEKTHWQREWWLFNPLTDLSQCFMVVEKMHELGWALRLISMNDKMLYQSWFWHLDNEDSADMFIDSNCCRAILAAALKAKGAGVQ